jgi:hypothetical protein
MPNSERFHLAEQAADFSRLGLDPAVIKPFEDGSRISTDPGNLEWWYFDAHLDNGAMIVVVFNGRSAFTPTGPFQPTLSINIDLPDGRKIAKVYRGEASDFSAAKEHCDVRIGRNRFVGDLKTYRIVAEVEDVSVDIDLVATVPPFRVGTSHSYFRRGGREKLFAWLPAVPQGKVTARYRVGDAVTESEGYGYHDHNWGDAPMWEVMNDWYWARAKVGPYTTIVAYVTAAKAYGFEDQINFFLAKDGRILASDRHKVTVSTEDVFTDPETGKPVANRLRFDFEDADQGYSVSLRREATILSAKMADQLPPLKRLAAKLVGFDGAYLRFGGEAEVEARRGGQVVDRQQAAALWELMYFGKARPPKY